MIAAGYPSFIDTGICLLGIANFLVWGRHPYRMNIAMMQTRLIPGQVAKLCANLPVTHLDLTTHPGHFDFVSASPQAVSEMVRQTVEDAGRREVGIHIFAVAHTPADIPRLVANLRACYQAIEELEGTS